MDLIKQFLEYLNSQKEKPSRLTIKNYKADVDQFVRWYEEQFKKQFNSKTVTPQIIEFYKKTTSSSLSLRSLERHLSSLRKFFHFLKVEGLIPTSPFELDAKHSALDTDPWRLKDFKNYLYVYNASHLTIKNYVIDVKQFLKWAEEATGIDQSWDVRDKNIFDKIDGALIEEYKKRLINESGFSPLSINRKLSSLRKYLTWLKEAGIIKNDTPLGIKSVREYPLRSQHLEGTYWATPEVKKVKYSRIPPIRLLQKLSKGINTLFEATFVSPLAKIVDQTRYLVWKMRGKPIFERLKTKNQKLTNNIKKEFYAPLSISTKYFPISKKIWFHLRYSRPDWYRKYHQYSITHYFHLAILIIIMSALGFGFYQAFVTGPKEQRPALAAPVAPPRILSFQGRLTDASDNPITGVKNLRFAIYNHLTASGAALLWQEVNSVSPDTDGIFSILLGNVARIPQSLFAENASLWLGVTVETDSELAPRQQLATVAYATNAEVLQGMPPVTDAGVTGNTNAILALDSGGNISIAGTATTTFQSTGGQMTLTGKVLALTTASGTGTNIQITPDGLGKIDLQKPIRNSTNNNNIPSAAGSVEVDDLFSVLATSSGQSAFTINQGSTGPLISASTSGVAKFTVDYSGNTALAGTITLPNSSVLTGDTTYLRSSRGLAFGANETYYINNLGTANLNAGTFAGLITANGGVTIPSSANLTVSGTGANGVASSLIPTSSSYNLGAASYPWGTVYANSFVGGTSGISGYWQRNLQALSPTNITDDLLIGGTASSSAKFQVFGAGTYAGTASTSGSLTFNDAVGTNPSINVFNSNRLDIKTSVGGDAGLGAVMSVLNNGNVGIGTTNPLEKLDVSGNATISGNLKLAGGARSIQGTANNAFTIGGDTTGNITLAPLNGITGAYIAPSTNNQVDLGTSSYAFRSIYVTNIYGGSSGVSGYWQRNLGALSPTNITDDLLLGATATSSSRFAVLNMAGGNPTATMSSNLSLIVPTGSNPAATFNLLNGGSLNIQTSTIGQGDAGLSSRFYIANSGNVGIGTTGPNANLDVNGDIDWSAGNVIYVPLTGDIQTYVNNASAGDTLILASGEYVITSTITINKQLNIVGQGNAGFATYPITPSHGTIISSTTGGITAFNITSDNVRIAHLSLNLTGAVSQGIQAGWNLQGIVLTNIDVIVTCSGTARGFSIYSSDVVMRDLTFYITSTDENATGVWAYNDGETTNRDSVVDAFNVTGTTKGNPTSGTYNYAFICENDGGAYNITCNFNNSRVTALAGTALDVAVAAFGNTSTVNAYLCTFDGQDYDVYQSGGTSQINLGGSVIVNNLTFGDVTYRAAMISGIVQSPIINGGALANGDITIQGTTNSTRDTSYVVLQPNGGNVGIGTTAPLSKLHISGAVVGKSLVIFDETGDQNIWTASASGTTTVANLTRTGDLELKGQGDLRLYDADNSNYTGFQAPALSTNLLMTLPSTVGSSGYALTTDGAGTLNWSDIASGGSVGPWTLSGTSLYPDSATYNVLIGSTTVADAVHKLLVTGTNVGKALAVLNETGTNDIFVASNSGTARFVIQAAGNVGIGTTSPLATLDVRGNSGTTPVASFSGQTSFAAMVVDNKGLGDIFTASSSGLNRFVITQNGNVGIGTTAPAQKLHIAGRLITNDKISDGLVGSWHFDENTLGNASGQTLTDDSGYGNNGTGSGTNGPIWGPGKIGSALTFDGTDDYVGVSDSSVFDVGNTDSRTWEVWVKPGTMVNSYDTVFTKGSSGAVDGYYLRREGDTSTAPFYFYIDYGPDDATWSRVSCSNLGVGVWHHVVVVLDRTSNQLLMYLNGALASSGGGNSGHAEDNSSQFRVGISANGGNAFAGTIDEVRVYQRALSSDEVQARYEMGTWEYQTNELAYRDGSLSVYDHTSLGSEKVTNGTFADNSVWTWGTGWAHDAVNLEADHTAGNTAALEQSVSAVAGEVYEVVFTIKNRTAGTITPQVGGVNGTAVSVNSTYTQQIRATGTGNLKLTPSTDFDGSIDDVSVKLITGGNIKLAGLLTGGGSSGIKVTAAGNVGIGTTSPLATLDVRGSSGTTPVASISGQTSFAAMVVDNKGLGDIFTASSSGLNRFVITQNGNVGIGTTSPSALLSVGSSSQFQVSSTGAVTAVGVNSGSGLLQGTGGLTVSGNTTLAATAGNTVDIGNSTGAMTLASGGTSAWTNTAGNLTISTATSGTLALTSAGALNLSAGSASTWTLPAVANALNIDSNTLTIDALNDRVGIGTTAPAAKLEVYKATGNTALFVTSADSWASLRFNPGVANDADWEIVTGWDGGAGVDALYFLQQSGTGTGTKMVIDSNTGNVGIGDVSPASLLTVGSGDLFQVNSSGTLTFNGVATDITTGTNEHLSLMPNGSGNVGIGTVGPDQKLDVLAGAGGTQLRLTSTDGSVYSDIKTDQLGYLSFVPTGAIATFSATVNPNATSTYDLGSATRTWRNIYVDNIIGGSSGVSGYWQRILNALSPTNITDDLLIGGTASSSAKFQVFGSGTYAGTASTSGSLTFNDAAGTNPSINVFNSGRLDIKTSVGGDAGLGAVMSVLNNGNVGIGTTNPLGTLSVLSANTTGVTTSSALNLSANSLTTGTGLYAASSTLTSGLLMNLQVSGTAAAASQTALNILTTGANATNAITTYGAQISNTHTNATSGTNVALYLNASGATTANYGLIVNSGNVGIGTTAPVAKLEVSGTNVGKALAIFNETGTNDILTASASGSTKLILSNTGNLALASTSNSIASISATSRALAVGSAVSEMSSIYEEGTTNAFTNPSVETNTTSWSAYGATVTIARTTDTSYIGSYSLQTNTSSAGNAWDGVLLNGPSAATVAGKTYTFSAYIKRSETTSNLEITLLDCSTGTSCADAQATSTTIPQTTDWQRVSVTRTFRSGIDTAQYLIQLTAPAVTTYWYTDGVQMEEKSYMTSYADGSLGAGYTWAGTAHASASTRASNAMRYSKLNPYANGSLFMVDGLGNLANLGYATTSASLAVGYSSVLAGVGNAVFSGNVGIGTTNPGYKLAIATSTANDRGINIAHTATTGTNYGVYSSVTGAATANYGGYFVSTGATTNYGLSVAALTGATSYGLDIGSLSGATANYGVNIGAISGAGTAAALTSGAISATGATAYQLNLGAISGANATSHTGIALGNISGTTAAATGLSLGTLTGGTSTNYQITTGTLTGIASATNTQLNLGTSVGAASATTYGINIGAISGAGTATYGINIGANSATATTNYGQKIGAVSGAGTTNYGLYVDTVSGASNNYAAIFAGGNVGIGTTAPDSTLHLKSSVAWQPHIKLENLADGDSAAVFDFYKTSPTPADHDNIGTLNFFGLDDTLASQRYVRIDTRSRDISDGHEAGAFYLYNTVNGAEKLMFYIEGYQNSQVGEAGIIFNDDSVDADFRVESDNSASAFFVEGSTGNVGIGTTSPLAMFDVRGSSGTTPVASFSGQTSFAAMVVDNSGLGDFFTASSSGATRFKINNSGSVYASSFYDLDNVNYFLDPASTGTSLAVVGKVGIGTTVPGGKLDVVGAMSATTETLRPNAAGDETAIDSQYPEPGSHWDKVDEATPDEENYFVYTVSTSYQRDLYNLPSATGAGTISKITVYFRADDASGSSSKAKPSLKTHSTTYDGNEVTLTNAFADYSQDWTTNPYTGQPWTWNEIESLQIGVNLKDATGSAITACTQVYVVISYTPPQFMVRYDALNRLDLNVSSTGGTTFNAVGSGAQFAFMGGNVGIGTTSPLAMFDVRGSSGTTPVASFSGQTSFAAMVVDNSGLGDIFTASSSGLNRFVITQNGNVGIGTTGPSKKLQVSGGQTFLGTTISDTTGAGALLLGNSTTDYWSIRMSATGSTDGLDLNFDRSYGGGGYSGLTPVMTLRRDTGNVGIGRTDPDQKLVVNGGVGFGASATSDKKLYSPADGDLEWMTHSSAAVHGFAVSHQGTKAVYLNIAGDSYFNGGDVGIGTTGPTAKLHVDSPLIRLGTSVHGDLTRTNNGDFGIGNNDNTANGGRIFIRSDNQNWWFMAAGTGDVSEFYLSSDQTLKPGKIVSWDQQNELSVKRTSTAYDSTVAGIISPWGTQMNNPDGMRNKDPNYKNVGLLGQVPLVVTTQNGPIERSDPITSSSLPGIGMLSTKPGNIVARALQEFNPNPEICQLVNSLEEIVWPEDIEFQTPTSQCYRLPSGELVGRILVFVNVSWFDPDVYLTSTGDLNITQNNTEQNPEGRRYSLANSLGEAIERVSALTELAVANLRAGFIEAQEITTNSLAVATENITVGGQSLRNYIAAVVTETLNSQLSTLNSDKLISPLAEVDQIHTNIISPLAQGGNLIVKLASESAVQNSEFIIQNSSGSAVATIDSTGKITADSISVNQSSISGNLNASEASISGTLRAKNIVAETIEGLEARISTIAANHITNVTNFYEATPSAETNYALDAINIATFSSQLAYIENFTASFGQFNQGLIALGPASFTDVSVANQLSINGNLILADNSINVLGGNLELQPLKQGGVSIMGGLVYIDTEGNLKVEGNAEFAKDVTVKGRLSANIISPIPDSDLVIHLGDETSGDSTDAQLIVKNASGSGVLTINQAGDLISSGSGMFSKLNLNPVLPALAISESEVIATGSAGVATISAHLSELTIQNSLVTDKSLIYITPTADTDNQVLYLLRQLPGVSFTVGVNQPSIKEIPFNWLIVN